MSGVCENGNTLPIDLDKSELVNVSEQLTRFKYDFLQCNEFDITVECPGWLSYMTDCTTGVIKIEQKKPSNGVEQLLNLSTMGNLIGTGNDGNIVCYYFPTSLNFYNGEAPTGGEIVIELRTKQITGYELLLLFIPVILGETNLSSTEWFNNIIGNYTTKLPSDDEQVSILTRSMSLNSLIPKSQYWVYNEIQLHGKCQEENDITTHAIFFDIDYAITIYESSRNSFNDVGPNNIDDTDPVDIFGEEGSPYKQDLRELMDIGNNSFDWKEIWHKKIFTDDAAAAAAEYKTKKEEYGDPVDADKIKELEELKALAEAKVKRDLNPPNRGSIFSNEQGTKKGPGDNSSRSDPFSLTCEPIVDEDDKPIDGKDRLEWVKEIYNSDNKTLQGMKKWFWIFLFVIALTGILMALHVFIFKNIGLFITQNEIINRVDLLPDN